MKILVCVDHFIFLENLFECVKINSQIFTIQFSFQLEIFTIKYNIQNIKMKNIKILKINFASFNIL